MSIFTDGTGVINKAAQLSAYSGFQSRTPVAPAVSAKPAIFGENLPARQQERMVINENSFINYINSRSEDAWYIPNFSFQQTTLDVLMALRLVMYDAYGGSLVRAITDAVVGRTGIRVEWKNVYLQYLWDNHSFNLSEPDLMMDEIQRNETRDLLTEGEILSILETARIDGALTFGFVPVSALDLPMESYQMRSALSSKLPQGTTGITYGEYQRPREYHFRPYSPNGTVGKTEPVPASRVIHIFRRVNANQLRGLSWLRPSFAPLLALIKYEKDYSQVMHNAAASPGHYSYPLHVGYANTPDPADDADAQKATREAPTISGVIELKAGVRKALPENIQWHPEEIPSILSGGDYEAFKKGMIQRAARGIGLSYSSVAGMEQDGNFSSLSFGDGMNRAVVTTIQGLLERWLRRLASEWLDFVLLTDTRAAQEILRNNITAKTAIYHRPVWNPVDAVKDATAKGIQTEKGQVSHKLIIENAGGDYDTEWPQIIKEKRELDRMMTDEEYVVYQATLPELPQPAEQSDTDETESEDEG